MAFRVAGYVKLAKLWEKNRDNAVMLHNQYFTERFQSEANYRFVGAYIDITGNKNIRQRPEMIRLLRDCRAGRIDVIYTQTKAYLAAKDIEYQKQAFYFAKSKMCALRLSECYHRRGEKASSDLAFLQRFLFRITPLPSRSIWRWPRGMIPG